MRYLLLYLVSGLAGSAGALILEPDRVTVGASGAIFGILGAAIVLERQRHYVLGGSAITLLVVNLAFTFAVPGISIGGHLGGLVGGIILACWRSVQNSSPRSSDQGPVGRPGRGRGRCCPPSRLPAGAAGASVGAPGAAPSRAVPIPARTCTRFLAATTPRSSDQRSPQSPIAVPRHLRRARGDHLGVRSSEAPSGDSLRSSQLGKRSAAYSRIDLLSIASLLAIGVLSVAVAYWKVRGYA